MNTAKMELQFANGTQAQPDVANGTFALIIPDTVVVDGGNQVQGKITAKLFDAKGSTIYSGPVGFYEPPK